MVRRRVLYCFNLRLLVFYFKVLFYIFSGDGVIFEGNIKGRSRFSLIDKLYLKVLNDYFVKCLLNVKYIVL